MANEAMLIIQRKGLRNSEAQLCSKNAHLSCNQHLEGEYGHLRLKSHTADGDRWEFFSSLRERRWGA